ncbi:dioxygenase family protein [Taibaiella soli]|uniref:Intradiol ring-cleavage dioxygenases domain-containing protein n=1 Tax=Taibaiella soli TaxID=1649169 RepID=A0A2W2AFG5_9BACT|nr:T9SS type A sorting domain-containing protein [Taibaiella soli]PZF74041.1 hypothetical protein DN068_04935 [Taibaiella soli]
MERKDFLKGVGLLGIGSFLPFSKSRAAGTTGNVPTGTCVLIPQETEGPYPFDLSGNSAMYRQDITEGNSGTPLHLTLTIVNTNDNCSPVTNARVDIWHCNKDGYYSEYANQPGYLGTQSHVGETFFRGIQITDNNGQVNFTTIYPGWYTGRTTHIHFQIFLNSVLSATSQAAFPDSLNTTVYSTSLYSAHGQNTSVAANSADNVFSDMTNTQYELLTVTSNNSTGGYDASLTVGIAVPTSGVINLEPETGGQFKLSQNYPNPFAGSTSIPFTLANTSDVLIEVFDLAGKRLLGIIRKSLGAGDQTITLDASSGINALAAGNYLYQFSVTNSNGTFRQCKMMAVTR